MLLEALIALTVALVIWNLLFKEKHPIDDLPGPPSYPIVGSAIQVLKTPPNDLFDMLVDCTKKYGDRYVFKIFNLRVLHIASPQDIEVALGHSKNIKKSVPYEFLRGWLGNGLLLSTGAEWHKRRKVLTPTFHFNILKNFTVIFQEKIHDLVIQLKTKNGEYVDLMSTISDFTLFAICETAMGTKLDKDQSSSTLDYKNAVLNIGYQLLYRISRFWLQSDMLFYMSPIGQANKKTLAIAKTFAENVIEERKANRVRDGKQDDVTDDVGTKKRLAMLDLLLEAEEKGEIDMQGIRDEVNTFMFEGHDTTALALTFGLMLLADHEDVQERIYEEVQNIYGDTDRTLEMSELADMKYLDAVIKEILRLYPSVPLIGREITEDFKLGDLLVKKGTTVDIHFYELHRNEKWFSDPLTFNPDRFFSGDPLKHPYSYVPFSAGPRNCIGQRYALTEMKCTLSELVKNFKIVPKVKGYRPKVIADMVLRPVEPIYIKFIPRK